MAISSVAVGVKHDDGKDPWDLLPWDAVREVVKVLAHGAKKYDARNWEKGIKYSRVFAAVQRHLTAWWNRQGPDLESGLSHLAHAACGALFLLAFEQRWQHDCDDRPPLREPMPLPRF